MLPPSKYVHLRYFPLKAGNYWKLSAEDVTIRLEVLDRQNLPAGIMYRLRYTMDDEEIMTENLIVDHRGIWIHSRVIEGTMLMYDPPFPLLPVNYRELKWWNWQGTIGTVEGKATMIFEGTAVIDLEDEGVSCLKIKFTEENKYGSSTYIRYYGEHLGPTKEVAHTPYYSYEALVQTAEVLYDDYSYIEQLEEMIERMTEEQPTAVEDELPDELELDEEAELEALTDEALDDLDELPDELELDEELEDELDEGLEETIIDEAEDEER